MTESFNPFQQSSNKPEQRNGFRFDIVNVQNPKFFSLIFGQAHFIKTVEDLYEVLIQSGNALKFGIAYCEASGPRLIRTDGNSPELIELATQNAKLVGCGHTFFIFLDEGYPVNVINGIKAVTEVVRIFAATSNPFQVLVAETEHGRGVSAVIDGSSPLGVETEKDKQERKDFLRKIGYKR